MKLKTGYNLKLKNQIFRKIKFIAYKNKRSINAHLTLLVEQHINEYEKVNGKISEDDLIESEKEEAAD